MIMRGSQNNFKHIFDNSRQAMLLADTDLRFVCFANNAVAEMLGYSAKSLRRMPLSDIVQIKEVQKQNIYLNRLFEKKQGCKTKFCFMRKDKILIYAACVIIPVCGPGEKLLSYLLSIKTINMCWQEHVCKTLYTEKQKIKHLLFTAESWLKAIFKSTSDCIFIKDMNLRYLDVNLCMEKKLNMALSEIRGKTDADIFGYETAMQIEQVDRHVLQGRPMSLEQTKCLNKVSYTFHIVKVPIRDEQNNIIGICGIARDITARKQSEDALKKYEMQLETQNKVLMEKNMALKELISQVEQEKDKVKQNIVSNIEHEILPLLGKAMLKGQTEKYIMLIRKHLIEINSSLRSANQDKDYNFTPREAEISRLIRDGLTSKEISQLLNITSQTIDKHRQNIRKKLGIKHKTVNLISYLSKC